MCPLPVAGHLDHSRCGVQGGVLVRGLRVTVLACVQI